MPLFPDPETADANGLVCVGGDLTPATIVEAYTRGLFPWRGGRRIPWYSPDPRAILQCDRFRATRSLAKRSRHGLVVAFDRDLRGAMTRCATVARRNEASTWITPDMIEAYVRLHELGIAHSVEMYRDGEPVGGLYGLAFGRVFHGESMYFTERDASKLALWATCIALGARGVELIDCQVPTDHVVSLGAEAWPRTRYLAYLRDNATQPSLRGSWTEFRVASFA